MVPLCFVSAIFEIGEPPLILVYFFKNKTQTNAYTEGGNVCARLGGAIWYHVVLLVQLLKSVNPI